MTAATLANPAAATHASEEFFAEFFDSRGRKLVVDREKSIVRGVKLMGWESKNGREFAAEARKNIATLCEGAPVNLNHNMKDLSAPRDVRDRFGRVISRTVEDDGIYGDVQFNPKHEYAETFLWNAENSPESCGMSPVYAPSKTSRSRNGKLLVESVRAVSSIDLVADPATTTSLKESSGDTQMSTELLAEQIAKNTDLQKSIDALTTQVGALTGEKNALAEQVRTLTAEKKLGESKQAVSGFIAEAKLPADSVAAETRESWETLAVADADRAKKLVTNFAEAYHRGNTKPKSDPPPAGGANGGSELTIAELAKKYG